MIDWSKNIETVPDERNLAPVLCKVVTKAAKLRYVAIGREWRPKQPHMNDQLRGFCFAYDSDGKPKERGLPHLRNARDNHA